MICTHSPKPHYVSQGDSFCQFHGAKAAELNCPMCAEPQLPSAIYCLKCGEGVAGYITLRVEALRENKPEETLDTHYVKAS